MDDTINLTLNPRDRLELSTTIENLINLLDALEPDPDLEPWLGCGSDDREGDCEDEGADTGDDEHPLGWLNEGSQGHLSFGTEGEAELGWTEEVDQVRRTEVAKGWLCDDGEPELGWGETHGKGFQPGDTMDDREGDDERDDDGDRGDCSCSEDEGFLAGCDGTGNVMAEDMLRSPGTVIPAPGTAVRIVFGKGVTDDPEWIVHAVPMIDPAKLRAAAKGC